ncbi:MAG TPA: hypothetical protein VJN71_09650 [Nitrososphaerales archaeon]|nr:hypothetical protein [Nitrososphaerales archaeon]
MTRLDSVSDSLGMLIRNGTVKICPDVVARGRSYGSSKLPPIMKEDAARFWTAYLTSGLSPNCGFQTPYMIELRHIVLEHMKG